MPAYRRLRDFMRDEYLPSARATVAWTALPDGEAWYAFYVAGAHDHDMTPERDPRSSACARSRASSARWTRCGVQVGFQGDLQAFFKYLRDRSARSTSRAAQTCVAGYAGSRQRIDAALPKLFSVFPKADYEVREVEAFRAKSAGGRLLPAAVRRRLASGNLLRQHLRPEGAAEASGWRRCRCTRPRPGITSRSRSSRSSTGLPRFRRFGGDYTAYVEGWALYCGVARQGARALHGPVPVLRPPERRAAARDAARRRHRACTPRAGPASRRSRT